MLVHDHHAVTCLGNDIVFMNLGARGAQRRIQFIVGWCLVHTCTGWWRKSLKGSLGFLIADFDTRVLVPYGDGADLTYYKPRSTDAVIRFAFVTVGLWWAVFMLPLMIFVPERHSRTEVSGGVIRAAYAELRSTILKVGQYRNVVIFLIAYWLYIGGVFTVIFMAVNYGQRLGFDQQDLVTALLVTNFAGFPATLLYGIAGHRWGP